MHLGLAISKQFRQLNYLDAHYIAYNEGNLKNSKHETKNKNMFTTRTHQRCHRRRQMRRGRAWFFEASSPSGVQCQRASPVWLQQASLWLASNCKDKKGTRKVSLPLPPLKKRKGSSQPGCAVLFFFIKAQTFFRLRVCANNAKMRECVVKNACPMNASVAKMTLKAA